MLQRDYTYVISLSYLFNMILRFWNTMSTGRNVDDPKFDLFIKYVLQDNLHATMSMKLRVDSV